MLKTLHRPMMWTTGAMSALALASLIAIFADDRTLLGVPIWLKPFKFFVSLAIYNLTLAWLISLVRGKGERIARWLGTVIAVASFLEMAVIAGQAARGRSSHFNAATPLDMALFGIMGVTIVMVWVATAWIALLLLRQRMPDRATALAIRLGLLIALGGLATGFLMTSPTGAQLAEMQGGAAPTMIGAHAVGVADGGAGIPLVNWSSEGGDLRVPHFVGMHALQAIPLFAFGLAWLSRRFAGLAGAGRRARLVVAFAIAYGGLTAIVLWQALRGQSLIHPDALTFIAVAAVLATAAVVALTAARASVAPAGTTHAALPSNVDQVEPAAASNDIKSTTQNKPTDRKLPAAHNPGGNKPADLKPAGHRPAPAGAEPTGSNR
jgi:hypothetical protein